MSKRIYNIFFNTHTVSGIVISVALYIIFFAGAFALFKEEIHVWEESNATNQFKDEKFNIDKALQNLDKEYTLSGRDLEIRLNYVYNNFSVFLGPQKDTINGQKDLENRFLYVNPKSFETRTYEEQYNLGEFIYRLHFFDQLPYVGIYLSGFVALFFLFAIVTGVIVHWKKIISNFYQFNPKTTLKRVWTDAHTALGIIGIPYQFIFAITGAYFGLSILALIPAALLYEGDQQKLIEDMRPDRNVIAWVSLSEKAIPSVDDYILKTEEKWEDFNINRVFIKNYGGSNMRYEISGELSYDKRFIGTGKIIYNPFENSILEIKNPDKLNYIEDSQRLMGRLHFGNFGGIWVKITYFILALITCFVIITGVLIWIEARNKKSMTLKQRLFTAKTGHIYLAICLSLFPVIALFFNIIKLLPEAYQNQKMNILYTWFFVVWFLVILFFRFKRDNYLTNKYTLLSGSILGFLVPISNGIVSKNWIWNSFKNQYFEVFIIDALWLFISVSSLLIYVKINPKIKLQSAFSKYPIDYKNIVIEETKNNSKQPINIKNINNKNYISMRTKIIILWLFLAIGWIVHHIYGLFNIYYNETLIMEGATGEAPFIHHMYRIIFEGVCLLFALLTIELSKQWFKIMSFVWSILAGLYNIYHCIEACIFESNNVSEIFMLALVSIASIFLIRNLNEWRKTESVVS